jgi:hypothetical protein
MRRAAAAAVRLQGELGVGAVAWFYLNGKLQCNKVAGLRAMYGTFAASAPAFSGRKARIAILSMFAIVVCSIVTLTSMFPETNASSSELSQMLASHSAVVKSHSPAVHSSVSDNVDHVQIKWQKDEAALKADRAVLHKEETKFAKDMQQVQYEVGLQRKVVTDDKNLEDVELSQLPRAEFEYHEATAEAVVHPDTHSVYLLDAKQNQEMAVEREIRDQEQQLKGDLTTFRQHKHVQLDVNKEAAALSAEEKKLEQDKAHLNSDIANAGKQIKVSKARNAMLASEWSSTVNNLEEIKRVEADVENQRRQISAGNALKGGLNHGGRKSPAVKQHLKGKPKADGHKRLAFKQHLSEDSDEQPGTYEAATDSKAAAGIAGFAAAEMGGYHGAPTVFGARAVQGGKKKAAVKQHLSEDSDEQPGTYEAATDSKAAAGIAGFAAAEMGGYHGAPTVFGARAVQGGKKKAAVKQHLSEDSDEQPGTYEAATDSRAAAAIAGFAAADVAGQGGKACHGENCGPSVFGAKKSPQISKAKPASTTRLASDSFAQQQLGSK